MEQQSAGVDLLGRTSYESVSDPIICKGTDVKDRRGKQPRSRKITGLCFRPGAAGQLLVSSNDSRVRLFEGYTLRAKYKGPTNRRALRPSSPNPAS